MLHSKLSQAQRLDLGVVCITDQRKSFLCQLQLLMASSLHLSENKQCKKGANPTASAVLLLGQKGKKKSTQFLCSGLLMDTSFQGCRNAC